MILKRIVEFAERELADEPSGYQKRFVTKAIELSPDGKLLGVLPQSGSVRGKRHGIDRSEPQESPARTVAIKPRLFADNVNYVLGKVREKDKEKQVIERHAAWCELVQSAASSIPIPEVQAILKWLEQGGPAQLREDNRFDEDDELTFFVSSRYVTDLPEVRAFWTNQGDATNMGTCIVTGVYGPVVDRMPAPIKGVPDGQMSGTALISVNNPSGESYGLEAALNSPVSVDAAEKLCNGLNHLLNEPGKVDAEGKARKYKYSLRVGKVVFVVWTKEPHNFDAFSFFEQPNPEHVRQLFESIETGKAGSEIETGEFYAISLSANAARIVVRDYHEMTLGKAKEQIYKWFKLLTLMGFDGEPINPPGIYRLAANLYRDANKDMPAHVPRDLLAAALFPGRKLPSYLLSLALKRNLVMQGPYVEIGGRRMFSFDRIALIKAYLQQDSMLDLSQLNPELVTPAYLCGRLLAIYDRIQYDYYRIDQREQPNLTITDKYFGAAAASPGPILATIAKQAIKHLAKLNRKQAGGYHEKALNDVMALLKGPMPTSLSLEQQAYFTLGYYHQRAYRSPKVESATLNQTNEEDNS